MNLQDIKDIKEGLWHVKFPACEITDTEIYRKDGAPSRAKIILHYGEVGESWVNPKYIVEINIKAIDNNGYDYACDCFVLDVDDWYDQGLKAMIYKRRASVFLSKKKLIEYIKEKVINYYIGGERLKGN